MNKKRNEDNQIDQEETRTLKDMPDDFALRTRDASKNEEEWDEEFAYELGMMRLSRPTLAQIEEQNKILMRLKENFRVAGNVVAEAFSQLPAVEKVVLFGSVAVPLRKEVPRFRKFRRYRIALWHECADVDLAVWMNDLTVLRNLQRARSRALNELYQQRQIGVAHHQVDVFIMAQETNNYLGRLCAFTKCPRGKPDCLALGCGDVPFLKQQTGFVFSPDVLAEGSAVTLWKRTKKEDFKEDDDVALV